MQLVPIPLFTDNYAFALIDGQDVAVVDPGHAREVISFCGREGLSLTTVLLTHHHKDHNGGVKGLLQLWPDIVVYDNKSPAKSFATHMIETIPTPGHMKDAVSFYLPDEKMLFTGDTLFAGGCGRCFSKDYGAFYDSLATLAALPTDVECYGAHEYLADNVVFLKRQGYDTDFYDERLASKAHPSLGIPLGEELVYNPFLAIAKNGTVDQFSELRKRKDNS